MVILGLYSAYIGDLVMVILGLYSGYIGDNGRENGSYCLGFRV